MTRPAAVLSEALTARGANRRSRVTRYLNREAGGRQTRGGWISEIGFYSDRPFNYALTDPSNLDVVADPPRPVTGIELVVFGAKRDIDRLTSGTPTDRLIRSTRAAGASGLAPFPGNAGYLGAADLDDATHVPEKATALFARIRTASSGEAYHAAVLRNGAVSICAAVTQEIAGSPVDGLLLVAVEGAAHRLDGTESVEDAPFTLLQLESLAVYVAKVRALYPGIPLTCRARAEEPVESLWWNRLSSVPTAFETRVTQEGAYDVTSEVFRSAPPTESHRAAAQVALGHVDTLGASALLLGAYADIAASDRAEQMQEQGRIRYFVQRARSAHQAADASGEAAATAAASESLTPVIAPATATGPFVYNYLTGRWNDNER